MLDDARFQKIVRVIFWGGLASIVIVIGAVLVSRFDMIRDSASPKGNPIELKESEGGKLVVPSAQVPASFEERLNAPAVALVPSRIKGIAAAPVPLKQEREIISSAKKFISEWNNFSPGDGLYPLRLSEITKGSSLPSVAGRDDVIERAGICPDSGCEFGLETIASPKLIVSDYNGKRAYVIGYGSVGVVAFGGPARIYEQSYGIILINQGERWLVERAAGEMLKPTS
jgi:hypothetical protein